MIAITLGAGCGDDGNSGSFDAATADAFVADAAPVDGDPSVDARMRCPAGEAFFTGEYLDWDSTLTSFMGVPMATLVDRADASRTDETSPNGRWELCLPRNVDVDADLTQADYMDAILALDGESQGFAPGVVRGLKPARRDALFTEISQTYDANAAQLQLDARFDGGDPVIGAMFAISAANDGGYTFDDGQMLVPGATTTHDGMVFFANVAVGSGTVTVTLQPPGTTTCVGRAEVPVEAGTMTAVPFACN